MKHTIDELGPWGKAIPPNHSNIAALDTRRGGILILLPPSGADMPLPGDPSGRSARLRAKAGELICPVNGCGPYQTTVRNRKGRDHFRHRPATAPRQGHEPESLEHRAAKHAIAEWIHHQLNDLIERFEIDEYPITCADGTVLEPDVYVALRSGVQIAVEYQHSPGDVTTLERKQKAYEDSGIQVWWLFGPTRRTCPVIRKHPTKSEHQVQLTPAQTQLTHTSGTPPPNPASALRSPTGAPSNRAQTKTGEMPLHERGIHMPSRPSSAAMPLMPTPCGCATTLSTPAG